MLEASDFPRQDKMLFLSNHFPILIAGKLTITTVEEDKLLANSNAHRLFETQN
jgi:hypothetical protein